METYFVEAATNPATYPEGDFLLENTVLYDEPATDATSYFSTQQLAPGTYYFHVAAVDPATCDPVSGSCPVLEFSTPPSVVAIPPDPPPPPPPAPAPPPPPAPPAGPSPSPVTQQVKRGCTVPKLKGKSVSKARRALRKAGCRYRISGRGKVVSSKPRAGTRTSQTVQVKAKRRNRR